MLFFQFLEALRLVDRHPAIGLAPAIKGVLRNTIRPTDRPDRLVALFRLLQNLDNLFGGVLTRFHMRPPVGGLYHSFLASLLGAPHARIAKVATAIGVAR